MKAYKITANVDRDGQLIASDIPEVLGEAWNETYTDRSKAEEMLAELTESREEYGLGDVEYDIEEVEISDMVVVEIMPDHLRASHRAAGNWGRWPHNGADRVVMHRDDALALVESDPDKYNEVLEFEDPADYQDE